MAYAERAYFEHDHCHHCAARDEHLRVRRIELRALALAAADMHYVTLLAAIAAAVTVARVVYVDFYKGK